GDVAAAHHAVAGGAVLAAAQAQAIAALGAGADAGGERAAGHHVLAGGGAGRALRVVRGGEAEDHRAAVEVDALVAQGPAGGAVLEVGVDEFGRAELHARVVDLFLQRAHDAAVDLRAAAGVGADVQRAQRVGAADLVTEDHRAVAAVVQRQAARLGRVAAGRVDELGEVDLATG